MIKTTKNISRDCERCDTEFSFTKRDIHKRKEIKTKNSIFFCHDEYEAGFFSMKKYFVTPAHQIKEFEELILTIKCPICNNNNEILREVIRTLSIEDVPEKRVRV
jgi:hypothetical protein